MDQIGYRIDEAPDISEEEYFSGQDGMEKD